MVWGGVHAALFMPLILLGANRKHTDDVVAQGRLLPSFSEAAQMLFTFSMVTLAWIFFRSDSIELAFVYLSGILSLNLELIIHHFVPTAIVFMGIMIIVDWFSRTGEIPTWWLSAKFKPLRWAMYTLAIVLILKNLQNGSSFIYFQF